MSGRGAEGAATTVSQRRRHRASAPPLRGQHLDHDRADRARCRRCTREPHGAGRVAGARVHGACRQQRPRGAAAGGHAPAARSDPARSDDAGHGRLSGDAAPARGSADARHPRDLRHRAQRHRRRRARPENGRGRLHHQAAAPAGGAGARAHADRTEARARQAGEPQRVPRGRSGAPHEREPAGAGRQHPCAGAPGRNARPRDRQPHPAHAGVRAPPGAAAVQAPALCGVAGRACDRAAGQVGSAARHRQGRHSGLTSCSSRAASTSPSGRS